MPSGTVDFPGELLRLIAGAAVGAAAAALFIHTQQTTAKRERSVRWRAEAADQDEDVDTLGEESAHRLVSLAERRRQLTKEQLVHIPTRVATQWFPSSVCTE